MKSYIFYLAAILSLPFFFIRCSDAPNWDDEVNTNPPGAISNPIVQNINGGAIIFFTMPPDTESNLLGVKALYTRNDDGEVMESYASAFTDSIVLVGFPDTKERTVTLIAFNKSKVESPPVEVTIRPLTPPVEIIRNSLEVSETYSGIFVRWQNPTGADIGVSMFAEDSLGFMNLDYTYFTRESGYYAFRGYENKEKKFRIVVRDRWNNTATPLDTLLTPLFEEDVVARNQSGVTTWIRYGYADQTALWRGDYPNQYGSGGDINRMFDGIITSAGYMHLGLEETYNLNLFTGRTEDTGIVPRPLSWILDMTRETMISRFKYYFRNDGTGFNAGDPYHISIYATNETPKGPADFNNDKMASLAYWTSWPQVEGTDAWKNDWIHIAECYSIPPSGAAIQALWTDDDITFSRTVGFEYDFPAEFSTTPFRYLRFVCHDNMSLGTVVHFVEWEFYGSVVR